MSGSVNKVIIVGHLGKDPEVRTLNSGDKVVNLRVACTETWRDRTTNEKKERTEWVGVVIFNEGLAGVAEKYLKKGSHVYIEGKLQTRKWEKNGVDHYATECVLQKHQGTLVMLGSKDDDRGGGGGDYGRASGGEYGAHDASGRSQPRENFVGDFDGEPPF